MEAEDEIVVQGEGLGRHVSRAEKNELVIDNDDLPMHEARRLDRVGGKVWFKSFMWGRTGIVENLDGDPLFVFGPEDMNDIGIGEGVHRDVDRLTSFF